MDVSTVAPGKRSVWGGLIADNLFGPNALMAGPNGKLYYPLVPLGEIWRVDIETGAQAKVAEGLQAPPAVKFNRRGELIVPQSRTGEIVRIDVQSGAKTVIAKVRPVIDNLAFAPDNRMLISHFIDGGVAEVADDGSDTERVLVPAGFVGPWGLAVDPGGELYIGDGLSLATVSKTGAVTRLGGLLDERFPGFIRGIAASHPGELLITTARGDVVRYRVHDRSFAMLAQRLQPLYGIAPAGDTAVVVAGVDSGSLLHITDDGEVSTVASDLSRPSDILPVADGSYLVTEMGRGRVVAMDRQGQLQTVVDGLSTPKGMVRYQDQLLVLDAGARALYAMNLETRQQETLVSALPIGANGPMDFPGGLAVLPDKTICLAADGEGSLLILTRTVI